jgi:uncharacterized membrane protein YoaK (UPF0700 family)
MATDAQPGAAPVPDRLPHALLALTWVTGMIDAVSYLGLGRVFTANTTGNIVLLGFGFAKAASLPVVAPLVSLGAFVVGAAVGGRMAAQVGDRRRHHFAIALGAETALLAAATIVVAATTVRPSSGAAYVTIAILALSMGIRNATVRKLAVPDLMTTVLTMTITGLIADSQVGTRTPQRGGRRLASVVAMLLGAFVGALMVKHGLVAPLAAIAGLDGAILAGYLLSGR